MRLNGASQKQRQLFEGFRQFGHECLPDSVACGAVQHQPQGPLGIVLADENNAAVKERSLESTVVEQQVTLE